MREVDPQINDRIEYLMEHLMSVLIYNDTE